MKRLAVGVVAMVVVLTFAAPAQAQVHAATPVPGRFCKVADVGKKLKTAKYGTVLCAKDGDRARWKRT